MTRAAKGAKKKVSRVMTLLAPPLTVEHRMTPHEESVMISGCLVTYNEGGSMTVPPAGAGEDLGRLCEQSELRGEKKSK